MFCSLHVFVNAELGAYTVPSRTVISLTNFPRSHCVVAVAIGDEVSVGSGIDVKVGVLPGIVVEISVEVAVAGLFAASCACTVNAAAVSMASGFCWLGVVDGRLQARMAVRIAITAGIMVVFRIEFSS
jgi:hypothetical protein